MVINKKRELAVPTDHRIKLKGHSLWESYPSAEMQSVYSTATTIGRSFGKSYPSVEMKSVDSEALADLATGQ